MQQRATQSTLDISNLVNLKHCLYQTDLIILVTGNAAINLQYFEHAYVKISVTVK